MACKALSQDPHAHLQLQSQDSICCPSAERHIRRAPGPLEGATAAGQRSCSRAALDPDASAPCAGAGQQCRIMVAQPRRISAITLANRVAAERSAPLGGDVGYTIRLENK